MRSLQYWTTNTTKLSQPKIPREIIEAENIETSKVTNHGDSIAFHAVEVF